MAIELEQYVVNAFAGRAFEGNPAAVVPLISWLSDELMQSIAEQNNLAETAFYVDEGEGTYHIRWFTPTTEVDLCGHATLASAFVLHHRDGLESVVFDSRSGPLSVTLNDHWWVMDFPSQVPQPVDAPAKLLTAMQLEKAECYFNEDYVLVLDDENAVRHVEVAFDDLLTLNGRGVIVTAQSEQYDFVHRFFAPKVGVKEDPVTGSALTKLIPFWATRLGQESLFAKQVSPRGGEIKCLNKDDRVQMAGQAKLFSQGLIFP